MNITQLSWLIIATIASICANIVTKHYVLTKKFLLILVITLLYAVIFMAYVEIMEHYPLYWLMPITFISLIFAIFSGVLFFGEKLKPINIGGIMLGSVAIYLITK